MISAKIRNSSLYVCEDFNMKKTDYVSKIIECCKKREEILINHEPIWKYNRYYDRMWVYARKLIDENRQEELLPYLDNDSISVRSDIANILSDWYPNQCIKVLREIADMSTVTGLPKHFIILSVAARDGLKYGDLKDYM